MTAFIQSLVLSRWASASSSGFPENFGLNVTNWNVLIVVLVVQVVWVVALVVWVEQVVALLVWVALVVTLGVWDLAELEGVEVLEYLVLAVLLLPYLILILVTLCCILFYSILIMCLWYFFKFLLYFISSFTASLSLIFLL